MSRYGDIIAQLEAATGPSRDLDRVIAFDLRLGEAQIAAAQNYTHSIDAALGIVGRMLPGWRPAVGQNVHHGYWYAYVQILRAGNVEIESFSAMHSTSAPLAILIALFRALEAQEVREI